MTWSLRLLLLLGWLQLGACAAAGLSAPQETSVRPGVNKRYFESGALPKWVGVLEAESREVVSRRRDILQALPLSPGMVVADVGAGTGLFSSEIAMAVGADGLVYAVDIVPEFLARIDQQAAAEGLSQLKTVLGGERQVGLPDSSVDLAFLCNVYHHLEYPQTYLASLRRALRRGGRMIVVDFERIEGVTAEPMLKHVRAGKAVVLQEIEAAGFVRTDEWPILKENYILVFENP